MEMIGSRFAVWFLMAAIASATGCKVCGFKKKDLVRWYVPISETFERPRVPCEHVLLLESAPSDRKYRVVGIITPSVKKYSSWSEGINAARAAASLHGADAIILVSDTEVNTPFAQWGRNEKSKSETSSSGSTSHEGTKKGSFSLGGPKRAVTAQAIVWE